MQKSVECVRELKFEQRPEVVIKDAPPEDAAGMNDAGASDEETMFRAGPLRVDPDAFPTRNELLEHHTSAALQALGLLEEGKTLGGALQEREQAALGRYEPSTRVLEILEPPEHDRWAAMSTLAHEMIHGLQDQERDLESWRTTLRQQGFSSQAFRAYVEGEAQLYEMLALTFMLGLGPEDLLEDLVLWQRKGLLQGLLEHDSPFVLTLSQLPYVVGAQRHLEAWRESGVQGTDELAEVMPGTIAEWMRDEPLSREAVRCNRLNAEGPAGLRVTATRTGPELILPFVLRNTRTGWEPNFALAWHAASTTHDCLEIFAEPANQIDLQSETRDGGALADDAAVGSEPDAGTGFDADASVVDPLATRLGNVHVRWTLDFDGEEAPNALVEHIDDDIEISATESRAVLQARSEGVSGHPSPLVDCWPLYPFDPREVYVADSRTDEETLERWLAISHWSTDAVALGGLSADSVAVILPTGDLVRGWKLFTPDWCEHGGQRVYDPQADPEQDWGVLGPGPTRNDPEVPGACDVPSSVLTTVEGEVLFRCDGTWQREDGEAVHRESASVVRSMGYEGSALLATGLLRYEDTETLTATCGAAPGADAGSFTSEGTVKEGSGVLFPFAGLPDFEWLAQRAVADGYWIALASDSGAHELWHVDFFGCAQRVGEYAAVERAFRQDAALDAWGALYQFATRNELTDGREEFLLYRRSLGGEVEMASRRAVGTFVTAP